ncbi:MAG: type II toxin-antitoxin system HicA family toxin [Chloroflexota bacterium]|nr:type II toxin-antitoxin system HicA family toxin [Chloroflexota bacterium]
MRDLIDALKEANWYQARMKGDHRQFQHAYVPGTVTITGHLSDDKHGQSCVKKVQEAVAEAYAAAR